MKTHIRQWAKETGAFESALGPVRVGRPIGEGGNALVYATEEPVGAALKVLAEPISHKPSSRYLRFRDEYANLVPLVPTGHVVPLYHLGAIEMGTVTVPYVLMERCAGTLADTYRATPLRGVGDFFALATRLLNLLETVHGEGIVHRDVKPQNVLRRKTGDWVLADFGIAWFDPDLQRKSVESGAGDRLGNASFTAPEQLRRSHGDPSPAMDLFALGQTLYWCATGRTVRGAGHAPLASVDDALGRFDPFVEALIQQEPGERPQSAAEARAILTPRSRPGNEGEEALHRELKVQDRAFDDAIRRSVPGHDGTFRVPPEHVDRVLSSLAESCAETDLQFYDHSGESSACPLRPQSERPHGDRWLMGEGGWELDVADLWIHRSYRLGGSFVIAHVRAQPPFPSEAGEVHTRVRGGSLETAGWTHERFVPIRQFEDGYVEIDGEVVAVDGDAETRTRPRADAFFALAPLRNKLYVRENDPARHAAFQQMNAEGRVTEELVRPLTRLYRPWWMAMYD